MLLILFLVSENLFKGKGDLKFDSGTEPIKSKEFHHRTNPQEVDTTENHSPIIYYSFQFVLPLLGILFLSGYGPILITVDIRYSTENCHPVITEDYSLDQPLHHLEQKLLEDLLDTNNQDNDHHRLLSLEFNHHQQRLTPYSLPDTHSNPFLLLELICEALPAREEETTPYWKENPTGTYLTDTPNNLSSAYLGHPTIPQNPSVPLRNFFGIKSEPRNKRTFTELSPMLTLLSPLVELLTIEEDISCDHTTIDFPDTLAIEEPIGPSQDQIMVCTKSGRGTTSEENTSSWESQNPQEGHYLEPEYEYRSEPDLEQPEFEQGPLESHKSYSPQSDDKEGEIPEGLTLSTHPFYKGHQYPPPPPLVPPEDIELPPSLPSSSTSSTSSSSMAAVIPPPTPKEKGCCPDPFTQKLGYEKFCQQLSLFF
ncbi:hypothetical protein PILCRDRAFT_16566 [Piloderma croceum F 1598]|uniref:Uncharacterized protein n=1 Tax=Piloderma croceum (strain F 1598) TaxID=765440 RepID=A0A0C3ADU1_PILCF|nr:hypothetical protein PILCRDRAFT_16566 [Piloderma croceum F 1598]